MLAQRKIGDEKGKLVLETMISEKSGVGDSLTFCVDAEKDLMNRAISAKSVTCEERLCKNFNYQLC